MTRLLGKLTSRFLRDEEGAGQVQGGGVQVQGPIASEKTYDQQVTYGAGGIQSGSGAYIGYFTGDPLVDQIILTYRAPPNLGSTRV